MTPRDRGDTSRTRRSLTFLLPWPIKMATCRATPQAMALLGLIDLEVQDIYIAKALPCVAESIEDPIDDDYFNLTLD